MLENSPEAFRERSITLSSSVSALHLKIAPLGVIEGRVLDQFGDPIRGVAIHAIQVRIQDGWRMTTTVRNVSTDDRGAYRLWNLAPGKYYLKAAGRASATFSATGAAMPLVIGSWEAFAPAYSGGARDIGGATPVSIEAGSHATADFKLELEPSFKIRGVVSGFSSGAAVNFTLIQNDDDAIPARVSLNFNTGKFEVHDVLPGSYILRASQGQKRGDAPVSIKGEDAEGLAIDLSDGVEVKALIHTPPAPPLPDFPNGIPSDVDFGSLMRMTPVNCQVSLRSVRMGEGPIGFRPGRPNDHEWIAANVFPGQYRVQTTCSGGYPISVVSGSTDLRVNPMLTIQPGVSPPPIEVNAAAGGAMIKGKIEAKPIPETAGVLLVPASPSSDPSMNPVIERAETVELPPQLAPLAAYSFLIPFVPPGDYTLYLFSKRDEIMFRDPEFLRSLTGGVHVHLADKDQQEVTIPGFSK
jgi:hypothetical protein